MVALSATLIVRDEERHLPGCLRSIVDLVDEIVVVDTGSVDQSITIARAFGARVYERPWDDDFAAARNAGLEQASGDWVLYIDADERIRPADRAELDVGLSDALTVGLSVLFHPKAGHTPYREMRLFRNRPDIRFEGVIHENIWPALQRHMRASGGSVGDSRLVLDHEGYEGDQTAKHRRNLPLLERALARDPDRVYCWYHLGVVHHGLARPDQARAAWQAGIEVVRRKGAIPSGCLPYLHLLQMEMAAGRACRALLAEASSLFPDHAQLIWLDGRLCMLERRYDAAIERFERLLAWPIEADFRTAYDRRLFGVSPHVGLATCHFALGRYEAAGRHFAHAEACEPANPAHRVKRQLCAHLAARLAGTHPPAVADRAAHLAT